MKVGLYLNTQFPAGADITAARAQIMEQVTLARQSGFSYVWAPHHYLTHPLQMLAPIPLLAYIAAEAKGMLLGPNILVLPLLNPAHVAEDAVTLDLLSGGNYVLGVGVGYREAEFAAFNVSLSERVQRLTESIEIMRALWTGESVTFSGKTFALEKLGIGLKPIRPGGPPIWIGAVVDAAVRRAAQIGDAWMITNFAHLGDLIAKMKIYRDALKQANKSFPAEVPITRECYIGSTRREAVEECKAALEYKYAAYSSWGLDSQSKESETFDQPFEVFAKDRFIIGDKSYVAEEIRRYHELLGVNHFVMRVQWPGLEQKKVLRTISNLGEIFG